MTQEIWKPIPGYPDYEVSDLGRVRSFKKSKVALLKMQVDKDGYSRITLCADSKQSLRLVHQLVLLAFVGPCPDGREVCHGPDSDKANNRLDNLRYDTHLANMQELRETTDPGFRKHTREDVREMLERLKAGNVSVYQLAEERQVSRNVIYSLLRRHQAIVGLPYSQRRARAKAIREEYAQGNVAIAELAKKYGLARSYVCSILVGRRQLLAGGPIKIKDSEP